jgi:hypothetical protein
MSELDDDGDMRAQDAVTLRDYFAAKAMQALIAERCYPIDPQMPVYAWAAADAMLKARKS